MATVPGVRGTLPLPLRTTVFILHTVTISTRVRGSIIRIVRVTITDNRYRDMARQHVKKYGGGAVYVVIDELADLMTTNKKQVQPILQRLCQIGRAANVHVVAATQCPLSAVIPTPIKVNFDSRVALRTRSGQDSRNILGVTGCELLPRYGQGYYMTPEGCRLYNIPMYETETPDIIEYWRKQKPRIVWNR